eukprot:CAMPEP_0174761364 /NCGR_PEP_ID=MMETSP1094-20130205/109239_1 /TAXON_ID=156173 /ORGANISM="Chrysochromulina brevifilum, Strain UTEX LB 985" /LENGTH=106 /DNA_ID=CAMNT_0015967311 /DNA_START=545 /DNA_END=865 /DNA_ORIENTATION=+
MMGHQAAQQVQWSAGVGSPPPSQRTRRRQSSAAMGQCQQLASRPLGRRYAARVCLDDLFLYLAGAVGGSTPGTGAVVADGRAVLAAADVDSGDALSFLLSSCAHRL